MTFRQAIWQQTRQHLGLALYRLACKLNPAIPLAILTVAQQHGEALAQALLQQQAVSQHQWTVADRAATQ